MPNESRPNEQPEECSGPGPGPGTSPGSTANPINPPNPFNSTDWTEESGQWQCPGVGNPQIHQPTYGESIPMDAYVHPGMLPGSGSRNANGGGGGGSDDPSAGLRVRSWALALVGQVVVGMLAAWGTMASMRTDVDALKARQAADTATTQQILREVTEVKTSMDFLREELRYYRERADGVRTRQNAQGTMDSGRDRR
jgi:hypothetical protein